MNEINEVWNYIIETEIATEKELQLITNINGYNLESLNSVIYTRTGYHNLEQLKNCED